MTNYLKQGTNTIRVRLPRGVRPDMIDITTWLVAAIGDSSQDTWIRYLDPHELGQEWWCYDFKNPKHATLFALRWANG